MEYVTPLVGVGLLYLGWKQLRHASTIGEFKAHTLDSKEPDTLANALPKGDKHDPIHDRYIPGSHRQKTKGLKINKSTRPALF